jgi:hypothetical protein
MLDSSGEKVFYIRDILRLACVIDVSSLGLR